MTHDVENFFVCLFAICISSSVQDSFLACGRPVAPVSFVEKTVFPPVNYFHTFVRIQRAREAVLGSLFLSDHRCVSPRQ